jgi:hypothetical protein
LRLAGLVEGQQAELVAGDVALVVPGRDVAEDTDAARAGESSKARSGTWSSSVPRSSRCLPRGPTCGWLTSIVQAWLRTGE